MMATENMQNVKVTRISGIVAVEINGITYTPIGKFRKHVNDVEPYLKKMLENGTFDEIKRDYKKALELIISGESPTVTIEKEEVIFCFKEFKVSVPR